MATSAPKSALDIEVGKLRLQLKSLVAEASADTAEDIAALQQQLDTFEASTTEEFEALTERVQKLERRRSTIVVAGSDAPTPAPAKAYSYFPGGWN